VNYALQKAGITWHRLTERPQSARDHPRLLLVPHDRAAGPAQELVDALQSPVVDPYSGPPYAEVREQRIAAQQHRRIDIVICVHNALGVVRQCLESVRRARRSDHQRLIIIDDGSEETTARYLADFASGESWVELHRCDDARGYTLAANQGLAASTGELVILLNSDTIVTDGWAEKLADAVFSTPGAGIVGPMSNAASHQSIPKHRGSNTQTAINELPHGVTAEDMNRYCEQWTVAGLLPRVPLIHGFCFGVTREVIERLGLFDHNRFPGGYGEENDYCFRAADAGFSLVVATHTYIWHAKSESYRDSERVTLMKVAAETFRSLHGRPRIERAVRTMQENPILAQLRQNARCLPVTLSKAKNLNKDYKPTDCETTD
jgi:GT2 family glycosyltransferase